MRHGVRGLALTTRRQNAVANRRSPLYNSLNISQSSIFSAVKDSTVVLFIFQFPIFNLLFTIEYKGEVTELVPVPDFKSAVPWREPGKVSSILMLSRQ